MIQVETRILLYLFTFEQVDGAHFILNVFEIKRNSNAPRARRAEVGVENRLFEGVIRSR